MYGMDANIGLCFQSSGGTPATNSIYWMPHVSESVGEAIEQLKSQGMRGIYDEGPSYVGKRSSAGDLEIEALPIPMGVIFKGLMGNPTTSAVSSGYSHAFKPRQADWDATFAGDPMTYHQYLNTGSAMIYSDMCVNDVSISCAAGELLKIKASFVGGQFEQLANVAATYPDESHFTWDTSSVSINGVGKTELKDFTVDIKENLQAQWTLNGSKYPSRVKRSGFRMIEISGTIKFDDQTEYQNFLAQSEMSMSVMFTGSTTYGTTGDSLKMDFSAFRYTEVKPNAGGPGEIEASFKAEAKYDTSSATAMTLTLVNTQAAY